MKCDEGVTTKYVITGKLKNGRNFKPIYTDTPWNYNIWDGTLWELVDGHRKFVRYLFG